MKKKEKLLNQPSRSEAFLLEEVRHNAEKIVRHFDDYDFTDGNLQNIHVDC